MAEFAASRHLDVWYKHGDRVAIAAYLGNSTVFDEALADFAERYADQNEEDFQLFKEAISSGRIKAVMGV